MTTPILPKVYNEKSNQPKPLNLQLRSRDVPKAESVEVLRPPIFSNLQGSWSKVCHAARGLATVYSVTSFFFSNNLVAIVDQLVRTLLPTEGASAHHCFEGLNNQK